MKRATAQEKGWEDQKESSRKKAKSSNSLAGTVDTTALQELIVQRKLINKTELSQKDKECLAELLVGRLVIEPDNLLLIEFLNQLDDHLLKDPYFMEMIDPEAIGPNLNQKKKKKNATKRSGQNKGKDGKFGNEKSKITKPVNKPKPVDIAALRDLLMERGIVGKEKWGQEDKRCLANLLVGPLVIPNEKFFVDFVNQLGEEFQKDPEFEKMIGREVIDPFPEDIEDDEFCLKPKPKEKPLGREVDKGALSKLIVERGLITRKEWTEEDKRDITNLFVGAGFIALQDSNPDDYGIVRFLDVLSHQLDKDPEFQEAMDPIYLQVYTLPYQTANGLDATPGVLFEYPTFPPLVVIAAGPGDAVKGFHASPANEPFQWLEVITAAHQALCQEVGVAVADIGAAGARVHYVVPGDRFFLQFVDEAEREIFLNYIQGDLIQRFSTAVNGSAGFSFFTLTTNAAIGTRRV